MDDASDVGGAFHIGHIVIECVMAFVLADMLPIARPYVRLGAGYVNALRTMNAGVVDSTVVRGRVAFMVLAMKGWL